MLGYQNETSQRTGEHLTRDVLMGAWGSLHPPIFSQLQESCSKVSHAARGQMVTVFSVTFLKQQ